MNYVASVLKLLILFLIVPLPVLSFSQSNSGTFPDKKSGTIAYRDLNIIGEPQTQSQWCWAAVSATVINHYNYYKVSPCEIASEAFDFNCCKNEFACNNQNSILFIGNIIDDYAAAPTLISGTVSASTIKDELDNDDPLILRIESKFGGHFIVIGGYTINRDDFGNDELSLMIQDPMWGYQINTDMIGKFVTYSSLVDGSWDNYNFTWTHTLMFDEYE